MRKVRATEVPVGYVLITTEEYADLIAGNATNTLKEQLKEEKKRGDEYRDRAWAAEAEVKKLKGGNEDGAEND
jgi:cell division protein FtsB